MMTQSTLRTILAKIFAVKESYIVPKQGNWWNPQDKVNSGTWIAYLMRDGNPRTKAFNQHGDVANSEISTNYTISEVELQIVGKDSEVLAMSIQHWLNRPDVISLFDANQAQLLGDGLGRYSVSSFMQDGLNGVLAYNSRFGLQWANMFSAIYTKLDTATINGTLTIGA